MVLLQNGKQYKEYSYDLEDTLEKEVIANSQLLFGNKTIFIEAKRKIDTKAIGASIPDGFLFDLSDKDNPEFYLVEAELAKHDFYRHIFPQITKFFAFFKNRKSQSELIEKIYSTVDSDAELKKEFKKYLGEKEIFKFIKDTIETSQNILIVIDGKKDELPEIIDTYTDTWGKMVKVMVLKKFTAGSEIIYTVEPEFSDIEYSTIDLGDKGEGLDITVEFHLEGVKDIVKNIYNTLVQSLHQFDKSLILNPKKYYISIIKNKNISFITLRKTKLRIVVMMPYEEVKGKVKHYHVGQLSQSVQKFWNGPSCEILIESPDYLDEVIDVIKEIAEKNSNE
ncbi:hypothetical protein AAE02nite_42180 [Adhaeribacter aerolatus]|uniref:DUF5655 domain-containing protein n=1 Tax=Adhaeribacter aerolatus TaxID=670289 RepID=A0A512B3L9_9BACT|nr:hypothetical protein [Adhaeribacter aerolatus]GEO06554.1 hypothetical protein AAE02nite_42180 [Adhaeribacter aerolatus]